jgi:hypothetical protein
MANPNVIVVLKANQRWLLRTLQTKGIVGMAALWVLIHIVPFRWLFRVTVEPIA